MLPYAILVTAFVLFCGLVYLYYAYKAIKYWLTVIPGDDDENGYE